MIEQVIVIWCGDVSHPGVDTADDVRCNLVGVGLLVGENEV